MKVSGVEEDQCNENDSTMISSTDVLEKGELKQLIINR